MKTRAIDIAMATSFERDSGSAIVLKTCTNSSIEWAANLTEMPTSKSEYGHIKDYLSCFGKLHSRNDSHEPTGQARQKCKFIFQWDSRRQQARFSYPFAKHLQDGSLGLERYRNRSTCRLTMARKSIKSSGRFGLQPNDKDRGQEYDKRMDQAARFAGISELQGIYIYRNGRLIDFPGVEKNTEA